jgi:hypothetical protein
MARSLSGRKSQEWQRRFRRFHKSRQSVATFCRQEGISAASFYLWKKRLAQASGLVASPAGAPAGFRSVRLLPATGVDVRLPGGTQLVVPLSDTEGLRLVIETLARVDAEREAQPC